MKKEMVIALLQRIMLNECNGNKELYVDWNLHWNLNDHCDQKHVVHEFDHGILCGTNYKSECKVNCTLTHFNFLDPERSTFLRSSLPIDSSIT